MKLQPKLHLRKKKYGYIKTAGLMWKKCPMNKQTIYIITQQKHPQRADTILIRIPENLLS